MLIREIIEATGGTLLSGNINDDIHGFTQDTRQIHEGDMYIPLVGEKNDGHQFIKQAFEAGASSVITSQPIDYPDKKRGFSEGYFTGINRYGSLFKKTSCC